MVPIAYRLPPMAYRHIQEKMTMIQYMVNLDTCPDGATRAAIVELRLLVDGLSQTLDALTGNITSEPSDQKDGADSQKTPAKRRQTAKKAGT